MHPPAIHHLLAISILLVTALTGCVTQPDTIPKKTREEVARNQHQLGDAIVNHRPKPATLKSWMRKFLAANPTVNEVIFASPTAGPAATEPAYCIFRRDNQIRTATLQAKNYNYWKMAWYRDPIKEVKPLWTVTEFPIDGEPHRRYRYAIPLYVQGKRSALYGILKTDQIIGPKEKKQKKPDGKQVVAPSGTPRRISTPTPSVTQRNVTRPAAHAPTPPPEVPTEPSLPR